MKLLFVTLLSVITFTSNGQNLADIPTNIASDCTPFDSTENLNKVEEYGQNFTAIFGDAIINVEFSKTNMNALQALYPSANVRLYMYLPNGSSATKKTLPCLLMAANNSSNCGTDLDTVLFSYSSSQQESASYLSPINDSILGMLQNWRNLYNSDSLLDTFAVANGYNYSWNAINAAAEQTNLMVQFGIKRDTSVDSSVVDLYLTRSQNAPGAQEYLDFSKPCPRLCGQLGLRPKTVAIKED